jgi:prenyltransferase beta subunit
VKRSVLALVWLGLVLVPARAQTTEQKQATVAYLVKLQTPDGGFLPRVPDGDGKLAPSLSATSSALRALKYNGGAAKDPEACTRFVGTGYDRAAGGFADAPGGKPDVVRTAIGLMAVVELKLPVGDYAPAVKYLGEHAREFEEVRLAAAGLEAVGKRVPQADAWLEDIAKMRNADGLWGKGDGLARATGGAAVAVLRLGGKLDHRDAVLKALRAGQRPDGGWGKEDAKGSDLESTYRVMRCFHMLKERPDVEKCRAFALKCRNADGGYSVAPGQPSTVSGTYFASIVLHWLEE